MLAVVLTVLLSSPARAAEPNEAEGSSAASLHSERDAGRRVVVVVSPAKHDSLALLRAELQELGLQVIEQPLGDGALDAPSSVHLAHVLEDFRIVLLPSYVEVWTFERATGKVTRREVFAESDGSLLDARTAALHAVELLRWQLREREPQTRRTSRRRVPSSPLPASAGPGAKQKVAWLFSLVPQATYSPGGTSVGAGAQVDIGWRWSRLAARLFAATALVPNELVSSAGSAQVTSRSVGLQAVLISTSGPTASGFEGNLGLGAALVSTELRAVAATGYRAHTDELLTVAPVLDLRANYVVNSSLSIALCSSLMTPLRSSSLRFAAQEVGRYGRVILSVGAGPRITVF